MRMMYTSKIEKAKNFNHTYMAIDQEGERPHRIKIPEGHIPPTEYPQFEVRQVDVAPGQEYVISKYLNDDLRFQTKEEAQAFIDAQKRNGFYGVLTLRKWEKLDSSTAGEVEERIDCN